MTMIADFRMADAPDSGGLAPIPGHLLGQTESTLPKFKHFLSNSAVVGYIKTLLFYLPGHHLIKEREMKKSTLMLIILAMLWGCENTKGQNRHDPNHHETIMQNSRE